MLPGCTSATRTVAASEGADPSANQLGPTAAQAVARSLGSLDAIERASVEELTATEGRVAYARQFYNDSVLDYNNKIQQVPTVLFAKMLHFTEREYFEADAAARTVPTVEF